jgi:hypothetical protein
VAVLKGQTSPASRWVAFAWAIAMAFAAAGVMALLGTHGMLAWTLSIAAIGVGALLGAVLTEQRGIHPLSSLNMLPIDDDEQHDAT